VQLKENDLYMAFLNSCSSFHLRLQRLIGVCSSGCDYTSRWVVPLPVVEAVCSSVVVDCILVVVVDSFG